MTLELPRWLLADRLTLGLVVAAAVALETAVARYPGLPQGPGPGPATVKPDMVTLAPLFTSTTLFFPLASGTRTVGAWMIALPLPARVRWW